MEVTHRCCCCCCCWCCCCCCCCCFWHYVGGLVVCSALGPGRLKLHLMTASNMTLAAFTGTPVLDDGKCECACECVGVYSRRNSSRLL
jgi:hypothetical protein